MKLIKYATLAILTFMLLCGVVLQQYYTRQLHTPLLLGDEPLVFDIAPGSSFDGTLQALHRQGLFEALWVPKLYARLHNLGSRLKVGEMALAAPMTLQALMARLVSNERVKYKIQFIEGWTYRDALQALAKSPKLHRRLDATMTAADVVTLLPDALKKHAHPEGMLYPDTYFYQKGDSDLSILQRAASRLERVLAEEWQNRAEALPLESPYEALILASIIEKETGVADERREIAGVFIRRLKKNMRLQTDPTVIYGMGERYEGNIRRADLRRATPYNTYVIKGLPPTPIALAGRPAIHAALNPQPGDTLYFVAKGDGSHQFSETLAEHNQAVRKYQLQRRGNYRSSPK